MSPASYRRYDVQARYAPVLSVASVVPLLVALILIWRNYVPDVRQIIYGANSYVLALLACVALSMALGGAGCLTGFNSAGQRVNDRQRSSWLGFFLGGGVLTLNVILLVTFLMLRLKQPI